jgi:hypothetical protein
MFDFFLLQRFYFHWYLFRILWPNPQLPILVLSPRIRLSFIIYTNTKIIPNWHLYNSHITRKLMDLCWGFKLSKCAFPPKENLRLRADSCGMWTSSYLDDFMGLQLINLDWCARSTFAFNSKFVVLITSTGVNVTRWSQEEGVVLTSCYLFYWWIEGGDFVRECFVFI